MIKNVIWDFDGTLFNSYPYLAGALKDALAMHGIEEDLNAIIEKFMDCERAALEFFGAKYGMGWYVNWLKEMMCYANVYAGLIVIAVLFYLVITVLFKVRDKVLLWQKGVIKW